MNTVSRDEHVPEIERHISTVKERYRATYNSLPFNRLPVRMIVELVYAMTFWLHAFQAQDGLSAHMSPREIVNGAKITADKHCVIPLGAYAQTHEQHDNTMSSRTVGAIALRSTGNSQGGHFFFSLQTGKRISRNYWTELTMPADVVRRVHEMANSAHANQLTFGDRDNNEHEDDKVGVESIENDRFSPSDPQSGSSDNEDEEEANVATEHDAGNPEHVADIMEGYEAHDTSPGDDASIAPPGEDTDESPLERVAVKQEDVEWRPEEAQEDEEYRKEASETPS